MEKGSRMFTENEQAYLKSQRLARIATVGPDGQPDASPVGFEFDGAVFYVGGRDLARTRKYKHVQAGHDRVALIVDDLLSVSPWQPRGVRIYGTADLVERAGHLGPGVYLRITPQVSWSWGLDEPSMASGRPGPRKTVHAAVA